MRIEVEKSLAASDQFNLIESTFVYHPTENVSAGCLQGEHWLQFVLCWLLQCLDYQEWFVMACKTYSPAMEFFASHGWPFYFLDQSITIFFKGTTKALSRILLDGEEKNKCQPSFC